MCVFMAVWCVMWYVMFILGVCVSWASMCLSGVDAYLDRPVWAVLRVSGVDVCSCWDLG